MKTTSTLIKKMPYSPVAPIAQCGGCGRFVPEADLFACVAGDATQSRCAACFSDPRLIATLMMPSPTLLPDHHADAISLEKRIREAMGKPLSEIKKGPLGKRQPLPPYDHVQTTAREMSGRKKTNWSLLLLIVLIVSIVDLAGVWFGATITFMDNQEFAHYWHKTDWVWDYLKFIQNYHGQ